MIEPDSITRKSEKEKTMEELKQLKVKTLDGERLLSEAETKRYINLSKRQEQLEKEGFVRKGKLISVKTANLVGNLSLLPLIILMVALYIIRNGMNFLPKPAMQQYGKFAFVWILLAVVIIVILFPVHELIHGFFYSLVSRNGWKDVEFGFAKETLTPYCTCLSPVKKQFYIIGALLPMTILGIGSSILSIILGNPFMLLIGLTHILGGAGDILIVIMILKEKLKGRNVMIFDHPYDIGFIIFEKAN